MSEGALNKSSQSAADICSLNDTGGLVNGYPHYPGTRLRYSYYSTTQVPIIGTKIYILLRINSIFVSRLTGAFIPDSRVVNLSTRTVEHEGCNCGLCVTTQACNPARRHATLHAGMQPCTQACNPVCLHAGMQLGMQA